MTDTEIPDDPSVRDGRLVDAIAKGLSYAKTFTESPNIVLLLQDLGLACCETERAKVVCEGMRDLKHFGPSGGSQKISYDKIREYLLRAWA